MLIVGESLNATRKEMMSAVQLHDEAFVHALAREQVAAGAQMLDVNAAVPGRNETEDLAWLVQTVQTVVDVPLVLDSSDPKALAAAIAVHRGKPMINSLTGEGSKLDTLLPIVAGADCSVLVLCMDDRGISASVEERLKAARRAVLPLLAAGKKAEDIFVDPLVMAAAADLGAPMTTLEVLRSLRQGDIAGVRTIGGMSNVSFGFPARRLLNRVFLVMAMTAGLDACIVDVRDRALMSSIYAAVGLRGEDRFRTYLKAYRQGSLLV